MKICIITARFYPQLVGSGTSAYVIANELSRRGHEVTVLTDASLQDVSSHAGLPFTIRYVSSLENFSIGKAGFSETLYDLHRQVKLCSPDIIQVCNFMPMLLVSIIRSEIKCPVVFTFFNTPVIGQRTTGYFSDAVLDTSLGSFILQQEAYDQLILGSRHYVNAALSLGAQPENIKLSYLAPDVDSFNRSERVLSLKDIVNNYFPNKDVLPPYLLLPSRITQQKGIIEAIDALATVNKQSETAYNLLLTGMADPFDKDYARAVLARISELGLNEHILVPRRVISRNDLEVFFKEAQMVVVPSWYEGLGLAAIEAQYLGVPLAVSNTTGLNEVVEDGVNGVLFTPRNSHEIANAALSILTSQVDVSLMVHNAKETVVKFSLNKHIDELEETYRNVIIRYAQWPKD